MSDSFGRSIVLFIFFVSFMYMNFIYIQINSRAAWSNLTCNPLSLFTNSLFQSKADANRDFERCVTNISTTSTTNLFKKQKKDQEKVLTNLSGIQTQYVNLTDEVKRYTTDVSMIVQDYTNQINVLEDAQDNSNKLSNTAINKVDTFLSNITNIFDNISGYLLK